MRRLLTVLTMLILACPGAVTPAWAQPVAGTAAFSAEQRRAVVTILRDALRTDPSILREALAALQADDTRRQDQATRDVLALLGPQLVDKQDPAAGNPLGDVTVIEFYDTRCPYCRRMLPTIAELLRLDPKLKLVLKDIPILGNASRMESQALLAAQRQGGYFKLQTAVMSGGGTPTRDTLRAQADQAGLDSGRMLRDMDDPAITSRLQANLDLAKQAGIDGTPAFVIGTHLVSGAAELKELQQVVAEARANR